ncbi:NrdH-redoxin [Actinomycetaceae bacterium WB03_NA08]|uniref:NrdH-redoxin n=1 Tax=Scrofimicrobium canadense TaxID=2652290 RepID=A0A6N7W6V2_9ACTO|nr:glutaredoxin domain-containing protein [Scrofimicrobium canadense]MSS84995.1 NrdH-redoxin [Scrofimicrobium canadense]
MTITVYTKDRCVQCDATKRWLAQNNINYTELHAPDWTRELKKLGHQSAPVITITTPTGIIEDHWSGHRPDRLKTLKKGVHA